MQVRRGKYERTEIECTNERPVIPIIPAHREGQRRIHEPFRKSDVATRNRQKGNHFAQG